VLAALLTAGHEIGAMRRRPESEPALAALGATPVHADFGDPASLRRAVSGCDAIINLATHMPRLDWHAMLPGAWKENDFIRKTGSANLARAAIDAGVAVFIQESFAPAYPDRGDAWIDETVDLAPARYNRSIGDAERAALGFAAAGRRAVILRFGAFYGPDAEQVADLVGSVRKGWAPLPSRPDAFISPVSHDDAAAAVAAALGAEPGVYNVVDDEPLPRSDFYGGLARELAVPPPKIPPAWLASLMGSVGPLLARSQRVSNRKLKMASDWTPAYPSMREGWPATLREMGLAVS
jgi:nucleoside-diphosphate-sugar epimerase